MAEDRDAFKRAYEENKEQLKRDIRPMIARASGYNPEKNQYTPWEPKPYPTWVRLPGGSSVIANTKEEEDALLKRTPVQAKQVTVDIANLVAKPEATEKPQKRKYTKRANMAPLPQNLD